LSLIATTVTYFVGTSIYGILEYKKLYPANYYEGKIPHIENYLRKKGIVILNSEEKQSLNKAIPLQGIEYQVMNEDGNRIYGTDNEKIINNREELYEKINTKIDNNIGINKKYTKIIPILDSEGKIRGAIALSYMLKNYYVNTEDKIWITPLFVVIIFSPFIYITIFSLLFSKKFEKNIGKPVNILIQASKNVKNKNLDFNIDYNADNEIGRLCGAFSEMKSELKKSLISQWRIEQERHEMVEALAHDLKTPISIIKGYTESLLEDNYNDKQKLIRYLNVIKENTNKGSRLIKEMLYAAELEDIDTELCTNLVDMNSFMSIKKESYEMIGKEKRIIFIVNVSCEYNYKRSCSLDISKLERILDNIVLNSIHYTPEYGEIAINAYINDKIIKFTVKDTGKGFSSKDLSNIFNKFYRGDQSRSSKNGNSGLGLYIAKKLVELHEGSIKAFNLEQGGACIEFILRLF
jgi:signal transduction histidine kinase